MRLWHLQYCWFVCPYTKKRFEPNVAGSRGGSLSQMPTRSMTSFIFSPLLSWQKSAKRWRWIWWGLARLKMENVGWQLTHAITTAKSLPKNLDVVQEWTIIIIKDMDHRQAGVSQMASLNPLATPPCARSNLGEKNFFERRSILKILILWDRVIYFKRVAIE